MSQSLELPTLALDQVPGETAVQDRQQAIDQDQCHIMPGGVRRNYVSFYLLDATVANGFQRPENRDIVVLWVLAQVFQPLLGAVPISVISVIPQHRAALGLELAEELAAACDCDRHLRRNDALPFFWGSRQDHHLAAI